MLLNPFIIVWIKYRNAEIKENHDKASVVYLDLGKHNSRARQLGEERQLKGCRLSSSAAR